MALIRPFILRVVLLTVVAVQVFRYSHDPHFERACSARQPDIRSKSFLCATYHANNSLNLRSHCKRLPYARGYARKPDLAEIIVSLFGQSLPANHEK